MTDKEQKQETRENNGRWCIGAGRVQKERGTFVCPDCGREVMAIARGHQQPKLQRHRRIADRKADMRDRFKRMHDRCYRKDHYNYPNYGARGIYVVEEWHDFENFYAHFGDIPDGLMVDRIDNDGPYAPWNCKLSTLKENCRNRRVTKFLEFEGKRLTVFEWSEIYGIEYHTLWGRLKSGWSAEDALTVPVKRKQLMLKRYKRETQNGLA